MATHFHADCVGGLKVFLELIILLAYRSNGKFRDWMTLLSIKDYAYFIPPAYPRCLNL